MQVGPLKRVAALFMAFVFLLGCLPAYAAQGNDADGRVIVEDAYATEGGQVTVSLKLEGVPHLAAFQFFIQYDEGALSLTDRVTKGLSGVQFGKIINGNSFKLSWMESSQNNVDVNTEIAELTFAVNANASLPASIQVSYDAAQQAIFYNTENGPVAVNPKPVEGVILPQGKIAIKSVRRDNTTITADVSNPDSNALAFCCIYNKSGRFVASRSCKITDASTYDFQFDGYRFEYAKVFLLSTSLMPLCKGRKSQ